MLKKLSGRENTLQPFSVKKEFYSYLTNYLFMLCLCVTALLMYGFFLTHNTISVDDLSGDRYYNGALFAQGRYTSTIIHKLLGLTNEGAWVLDLLGVFSLMASSISFCVLFDRYINCTSKIPQIVFAGILISAPIYAEIFVYNSCTLSIGGGMLLASFALLYMTKYLQNGGIKNIIKASILIAVVASWYESIVFIYFEAVFAIMLLRVIQSDTPISIRTLFLQGLTFALPLIFGVVSEFLFHTLISSFVDFGIENYAANTISSPEYIIAVIVDIIYSYVISGFWHSGITPFVIFAIVAMLLCVFYAVRKKSWTIVLLFFGLAFSVFALCFVAFRPLPYRAAQTITFFNAFIAYLAVFTVFKHNNRTSLIRKLVIVLSAYAIIYQVSQFNYWMHWETLRYEEERNVMIQIAEDIKEYGTDKPIVVIGQYQLSNNIMDHSHIKKGSFAHKIATSLPGVPPLDPDSDYPIRITQTVLSSYIAWGTEVFGEPNSELHKFWNYLGYSFVQATNEMYAEAEALKEGIPGWPAEGSIVDCGEYIVIRLGDD